MCVTHGGHACASAQPPFSLSSLPSTTHPNTHTHTQIQFLADCDHPNVVRYLGSFRQPESLWIVMEHCGGGSVGDLLQVSVCV